MRGFLFVMNPGAEMITGCGFGGAGWLVTRHEVAAGGDEAGAESTKIGNAAEKKNCSCRAL
jgi:hypothetical protein